MGLEFGSYCRGVSFHPAPETPVHSVQYGGIGPGAEGRQRFGFDLVFQVVHGDKEMVDLILDHPAISAISFVGSSDIAQYVYSRGVAAGKRVQAMGGAKNHGIVLPDADMDQVVKDLSGAAFGSAGERCMALPVVVPVGQKTADELRERLVAEIETLKVGVSNDAGAQYGPVVTAAHRDKIANYIQLGKDEGAELVVDGFQIISGEHRGQ